MDGKGFSEDHRLSSVFLDLPWQIRIMGQDREPQRLRLFGEEADDLPESQQAQDFAAEAIPVFRSQTTSRTSAE